jgi:hypothetical protein
VSKETYYSVKRDLLQLIEAKIAALYPAMRKSNASLKNILGTPNLEIEKIKMY